MSGEATITKIRDQAHQFAEVLSMEYGMPVSFRVSINTQMEVEEKIQTVIETVAQFYQIPVFLLTKKGRQREIVQARQVAATMLFREFELTKTLRKTGLYFGGQDHSTIIHAMQTVDELREVYPAFDVGFKAVRNIIESKIGTL